MASPGGASLSRAVRGIGAHVLQSDSVNIRTSRSAHLLRRLVDAGCSSGAAGRRSAGATLCAATRGDYPRTDSDSAATKDGSAETATRGGSVATNADLAATEDDSTATNGAPFATDHDCAGTHDDSANFPALLDCL